MKIRKLFQRAAAFALAAVTALSAVPATTALAAGDIGTISFTHTYDGAGNAIRYNSSANIGGHTAGGTGEYKYRMYVDGETAFCLQPGVPLKTGNTLAKASSNTWNALSADQKKAVGLALLYGYQGNSGNLSGSDDEKWLATQTLVWEFVTGCRQATSPYSQTSTTVYSLHFGSNYANSGARAAYDQIVSFMTRHSTIPSFMSAGKKDITKELAYKDGQYSLTLTDSNGVLSEYSFTSSDSNVKVSKSGNKLTITSKKAIDGKARITATRNNTPTVSSGAMMIAYGDPNLQDVIMGVENVDTMTAYINVETPTGTVALKKTSEDGVVAGISFTIKGDGFNKTVKTDKDGNITVEGLFPGAYTVTEQSIDRYEPQKTQTVTIIGGKTSTVTFSNTLKRGSLEVVKTSEDNLVEGVKFHLYGTSLSGLAVDEYAVTNAQGVAKFENVLISGSKPYTLEEVDTAIRYVVPASQTAPIEWKKVTKRSFTNILKKFNVTVLKTDVETGKKPQGDATLAGAVYGIYKGEELVDTYTTDENGQFTTKYYVCGNDWSVREIAPSEGYLLDTTIHHVGAEPELYTVEYNSAMNDVNEQVIKVDPISKRRLENFGEEDKFYIRDHHEPIISEEIFEEAQKILAKRNTNRNVHQEGQKRNKFSRKYAFSCMIKCGFCGGTLTRRNWHSSSAYTKTIWQCVTATKNGKRHCPHCKGIPEEVIENAFVKSYQLLCTDQQEVVDEFLQKVEGILNDDTSLKRLPKIEKEMADLHRRKEKLLDLRLDNNIDRDIYEKKNQELSEQLKKLQEEQERLMELSRNQDNTRTRLREFRKVLGSGEILESFDRVVFESVVEKIVIGGYNDEGVEEPLKITFVYKTGIHSNFNGKDFKPKRKNAAAVHNDAELCSYTSDEAEKLCLHSSSDTYRMCGGNTKETYLEILYFRQFYKHFVFEEDGEGNRNKRIEKYFEVSAVVDVGCGGTKESVY